MKGSIKKARDTLFENKTEDSVKHLVTYLFESLHSSGELPKGFSGANLVSLYQLLSERVAVDSGLDSELERFLANKKGRAARPDPSDVDAIAQQAAGLDDEPEEDDDSTPDPK
jgi:hypothetical protein